MEVSLSAINPHCHHGLTPVFSSERKRNTRNINGLLKVGRHTPAARASEAKRNNLALMSQTLEDQRLFLALPLLLKINGVRRSCSQGHRRVRSAILWWAETHSVLSCTRKGTSPEMPGSVEPQLRPETCATLTQTRERGLLDHSKERNQEIRYPHRQTPQRAGGNS